MSFTQLYILFVLVSMVLFNALIVLARIYHQTKTAPIESEYVGLQTQVTELEKKIQNQGREIIEFQTRVQGLETENQSLTAKIAAATAAAAAAAAAPATTPAAASASATPPAAG